MNMMLVWAIFILAVGTVFAVLEAYALEHSKYTLSRTIWTWSQHFPLLPWLVGVLVGGLAVHFWWEGGYCAPNTPSLGMLQWFIG